jgi:hypothetical protein
MNSTYLIKVLEETGKNLRQWASQIISPKAMKQAMNERVEAVAQATAVLANIEFLRGNGADNGDSVTILCDNLDGPCAVECCGEWTGWVAKRFEGTNYMHALCAAADARYELEHKAKK